MQRWWGLSLTLRCHSCHPCDPPKHYEPQILPAKHEPHKHTDRHTHAHTLHKSCPQAMYTQRTEQKPRPMICDRSGGADWTPWLSSVLHISSLPSLRLQPQQPRCLHCQHGIHLHTLQQSTGKTVTDLDYCCQVQDAEQHITTLGSQSKFCIACEL